jgi:hypothetical protein
MSATKPPWLSGEPRNVVPSYNAVPLRTGFPPRDDDSRPNILEKVPSGKHTKKLLNMAIEIVDLPIKHGGFPQLF